MSLPVTVVEGQVSHVGHHNLLHTRYNNSVEVLSGTTAARPAASAVDVGTLYWDTDTELLYRSNGTTWDQLSAGVTDHGALTGLADDDHPQYATNAELTTHEGAADPHTGYRLESADHSHQTTGLQGGTLDHGLALTGLTDDDHTQYILKATVDAKGDILVATAADTVSRLAVGANGTVLTAASGQATGLEWTAAASPTYVYKTASESVANNTLQDDNHLLFTLEANGVYAFEAFLAFVCPNGTTHASFLWVEPDGTFDMLYVSDSDTATQITAPIMETTAATTVTLIANIVSPVIFRGVIKAGGAGGTFKLQWAQLNTDAGNPTTLELGSWLSYKKLN